MGQGSDGVSRGRQLLLGLALFGFVLALWLSQLHRIYDRPLTTWRTARGPLAPRARMLLRRQLTLWSDPAVRTRELEAMRVRNPEWAFMFRTYLGLAISNAALREEEFRPQALELLDGLIDDTLQRERELGHEAFLLAYGHRPSAWVQQPGRSLFVDGEIALLLGARLAVADDPNRREQLRSRLEQVIERMRRGPLLHAESYPNECWMFCNTVALAALRLGEVLLGQDHGRFFARWSQLTRERLVDPATGMLVSAYAPSGERAACGRGGEGSSIWMAAHMLQIVDPALARRQYDLARSELADSFLGFGFSREWPRSQEGSLDIDSGPVIPLLGASASASGMAILGSAAFHDEELLRGLLRALDFAGIPSEEGGELRYLASNPVGDAVLLYALVQGPLWELAAPAEAGAPAPSRPASGRTR